MINRDEFIKKCEEILAAIKDYKLDVDYIYPYIAQRAFFYEGYGACVLTYSPIHNEEEMREALEEEGDEFEGDINDLVIIEDDFDEDDVPDNCISDLEELFLYSYGWYADVLLFHNVWRQKKTKSQILIIKRALLKMARELYKDLFGKKLTRKAHDVCFFVNHTDYPDD